MSAGYSAADYADALRALLPRGRVWPSTPDSTQGKLLAALGESYERVDADAVALVVDANPSSTSDLLPEWEETLGLPDPCLGADPTVQQRRDQVVARFGAGGAQSAAYLIAFAAALGFEIEITPYAPFRMGINHVGQPLRGEAWAHAFLVTIVSGVVSAEHAAFRVGQNRTGDPLASSSTAAAALECELRAIAPAHSVPLFSF